MLQSPHAQLPITRWKGQINEMISQDDDDLQLIV